MNRAMLVALVLALFAALPSARAQGMGVGPDGHANYVNFHAEAFSRSSDGTTAVPSGLAVDWGGFQSKYVATGTKIGLKHALEGWSFLLGGGPQFHIPLGDQFLLIPALNVGYNIQSRANAFGFGFIGTFSLAFAYKLPSLYLGLEGETPIFDQNARSPFFPGSVGVSLLIGFYY
jgi:hypothetical protein